MRSPPRPAASPASPSLREERRLLRGMRFAYLRRRWGRAPTAPPAAWGARAVLVPRPGDGGLAAHVFPHPAPRGVVVLGHPAHEEGKAWWHRLDRIPRLRACGFTVVTFDFGGFGGSALPARVYDHEWGVMLAWARDRFPDVPVHAWGASLGGYFLHHALARDPVGVEAAVFEDVPPNLLHYDWMGRWRWRPWETLVRVALPAAAAWLPAVAHAPHVRAERVLYVRSVDDAFIGPAQWARLREAAPAHARHHEVPGAGHLGAWRVGGTPVHQAITGALSGAGAWRAPARNQAGLTRW